MNTIKWLLGYPKWFFYKRFVYAYKANHMPPHSKTRSVVVYLSKHYVRLPRVEMIPNEQSR